MFVTMGAMPHACVSMSLLDNLRTVRDIHEKINYVHQNPVKRGIVSKASEYRWSSARAWETGDDEPISLDRATVPELTILDDDLDSKLMQ